MHKPVFTAKKLAERHERTEQQEQAKLDAIVKNIVDRTREEWVEVALECFPALHGEDISAMSKDQVVDHIHFYDIDYRSGKAVKKTIT